MPWVGLKYVVVVFPDNTHLLFVPFAGHQLILYTTVTSVILIELKCFKILASLCGCVSWFVIHLVAYQ